MNRISIMLALAACTGLGVAHATESKVTVVNAGGGMDAVKVVRDKDTGRIRAATPDEIASMGPSTLAPSVVVMSRPGTTMVSRPDGSATFRRSVEDLDSVVLERGADGKATMRHAGKHAPAASTQNLPKE